MEKAYSYIRFSNPEQKKGDSLRRQSKDIEQIASKLGLELDDTLHLSDEGVSGYTGANRTKGALSEFLKLVEQNKITVGSCLIIESWDRLSREELLETNHLMTGILLKGIDIYTMMDSKHFTKNNFTSADLIISGILLEQGHIESAKRSVRLRAAWGNKRKDAVKDKRKMSRGCPLWLEPVGFQETPIKFVTTGYKPIPERVEVIKLIYQMKLSGKGSIKIAKELNQIKGIWKPSKGKKLPVWNASTVELYLNNNRKLLGEVQLYRYTRVNGKRINTPDGEPFLYYPPVIDKDIFNRVQVIIRANAKNDGRGGGRGDKVNNLFSHMAICGTCGNAMSYINKGNPSLHGKVQFKCAKLSKGLNCDSTSLYYNEVEKAVLKFCEGLNVNDVMPNSEKVQSELSILQNRLHAKNGEIQTITEKMDSIMSDTDKPMPYEFKKALGDSYVIKKNELDKLKTEREHISNLIAQQSVNGKHTEEQINSIKELIDLMSELKKDESKEQELINIRLNLRSQLRRLIKSIKITAKNKQVVIFFQSGLRRLIDLSTSEIVMDAKPR